jgi:hypothetical protein
MAGGNAASLSQTRCIAANQVHLHQAVWNPAPSIKQVVQHPAARASINTINEQPELVPRRHNM